MMDGARTKDPERGDTGKGGMMALALASKQGAAQDSDVDEYERKSDSAYGTGSSSGVARDAEGKDVDGDVKMDSTSVLPGTEKPSVLTAGLWQASK